MHRPRSIFVSLLLLAGCAAESVVPVYEEGGRQFSEIMARRHATAQRLQKSGDLAGAAVQWEVLTLLAPDNLQFEQELAGVKAAIDRAIADHLRAGQAALSAGDRDAATEALLKVLALAPDHAEAAQMLRNLEKRRAVRVQADRVVRLKPEDYGMAARAVRDPRRTPDANRGYDLAQSMELFRAGDAAGGLAGFRHYLEANPKDEAARQEIGASVVDHARRLEGQGNMEEAIVYYEQALALRGAPETAWDGEVRTLKKKVSKELYEKGLRAYRTDIDAAIRFLEASVRYDPGNNHAALKLQEAQRVQDKLRRMGEDRR